MTTQQKPSTSPEAWPAGLVGAWSLHSVRELDADGVLLGEPYGPRPTGRLRYGPGGDMAVVIPGHAEAPAVAYIGDFDAGRDGLVRHIVHVGLPPFTEDQVRWARLDGDNLTLATDRERHRRIELHWERA
ncbi:lipocalin-like domain-containing protein [Nocardia sp. NEAU-G5]|uniref:Lipocalin-like domain-containing protein n=1 Tax=Nocardia albiluteola TaxID=2842303 RepID=A0ABS6BAS6_9NOCA|nr:lipocalin-like domain-containing protein [Nocardia albiluteola]MBU3067401.1 lipocalin-like domain-containing protein [Nocardia albiluteola]